MATENSTYQFPNSEYAPEPIVDVPETNAEVDQSVQPVLENFTASAVRLPLVERERIKAEKVSEFGAIIERQASIQALRKDEIQSRLFDLEEKKRFKAVPILRRMTSTVQTEVDDRYLVQKEYEGGITLMQKALPGVSDGIIRSFYYSDNNEWIFDRFNTNAKSNTLTDERLTDRFEVSSDDVLKISQIPRAEVTPGGATFRYTHLGEAEFKLFSEWTKVYYELVVKDLYPQAMSKSDVTLAA